MSCACREARGSLTEHRAAGKGALVHSRHQLVLCGALHVVPLALQIVCKLPMICHALHALLSIEPAEVLDGPRKGTWIQAQAGMHVRATATLAELLYSISK